MAFLNEPPEGDVSDPFTGKVASSGSVLPPGRSLPVSMGIVTDLYVPDVPAEFPTALNAEEFFRRVHLSGLATVIDPVVWRKFREDYEGNNVSGSLLASKLKELLDADIRMPQILRHQWTTADLIRGVIDGPESQRVAFHDQSTEARKAIVLVLNGEEGRVGRGGCAEIRMAFCGGVDMPLVYKTLLQHTDQFVERAHTEVSCLRKIGGVGAPAYVGYNRSEAGILMQHRRGVLIKDLTVAMNGQPLSRDPAYRIVRGAAADLQIAHVRGIVHGDVSANNIMICDNGEVLLFDYGQGRDKTSEHHVTSTGVIMGTAGQSIAYEVLNEEGSKLRDTPIDVFGLGVVLYKLRTGKDLFSEVFGKRNIHAKLMKAVSTRVEMLQLQQKKLAQLRKEDPELAELLGAMLDEEPSKRISAESLIDRLDQLIPGNTADKGKIDVGEDVVYGPTDRYPLHSRFGSGEEGGVALLRKIQSRYPNNERRPDVHRVRSPIKVAALLGGLSTVAITIAYLFSVANRDRSQHTPSDNTPPTPGKVAGAGGANPEFPSKRVKPFADKMGPNGMRGLVMFPDAPASVIDMQPARVEVSDGRGAQVWRGEGPNREWAGRVCILLAKDYADIKGLPNPNLLPPLLRRNGSLMYQYVASIDGGEMQCIFIGSVGRFILSGDEMFSFTDITNRHHPLAEVSDDAHWMNIKDAGSHRIFQRFAEGIDLEGLNVELGDMTGFNGTYGTVTAGQMKDAFVGQIMDFREQIAKAKEIAQTNKQ